ncbi:cytochrome C oxidase subunit IV family protein [Halosimplex rubrum]|uniref:Cytochrome C oxidase subunit IV family protein n=1 Tax=Halosimplex rubrum TaxID=869889 RepID=A0A7D5P1Z5_9EURY|nr:cytochrome C oxidase subunit IV family protein [Halosimplex rubrum]QLH77061.1 cytochrome C oxidase subunit IV family protein [Halosimplex rubrum]
MSRFKLYTGIFVVLMALSTTQALVERTGLVDFDAPGTYWTAFGVILALSFVKATFVATYYMHLRWEPRSVTYLFLGGLFVALALTTAAAYSIL